jgi:DNA polymerase III delta prime subunit
MRESFLWSEKYRPQTVRDCILPAALKAQFQQMVDSGNVPNMTFAGKPGIGKTTVAQALCNEIDADVLLINGSDENGIDTIRTKVSTFAHGMSLSGGRRYVIFDEADFMNQNSSQPALRALVEQNEKNCGFIFTCNFPNRLMDALLSRAPVISFEISADEKMGLAKDCFKRIQTILQQENVTCDPKLLGTVVSKLFPDFRKILNQLQNSVVNGTIAPTILGHDGDALFAPLWKAMREKSFDDIRKWVSEHPDVDTGTLFRTLYKWTQEHVPNKGELCGVIVTLADYQHKSVFAADQEINTMACLIDIMANAEFQ